MVTYVEGTQKTLLIERALFIVSKYIFFWVFNTFYNETYIFI